jgi:hypothetical protein
MWDSVGSRLSQPIQLPHGCCGSGQNLIHPSILYFTLQSKPRSYRLIALRAALLNAVTAF